jgi:DNA-binding FadR family transcriptional regulator
VERAADEELQQLRQTVLDPQARSGQEDQDFFFHYCLVELSGNSIFVDIINTYFKEIRQIRDSNLKDVTYLQQVQKEHLAIIDGICRRDKEAAQAAVEQHMERIWDRWYRRNMSGVEET